MAIDLTILELSHSGQENLMVMVSSKFTVTVPIKDHQAETMACVLVKECRSVDPQ